MSYSKIGEIEVKGKRIVIKDSMIMLSDDENTPEWPFVSVENGIYEIQVVAKGDTNSSVRVISSGTNGVRGQKVGNVDVDHGGVGIIDYDSFLSAVQENYEDYEDWTSMELDDVVWNQTSGEIDFMDVPLFFLQSGEGDGSYPVYETLENEKVVGLECDFFATV